MGHERMTNGDRPENIQDMFEIDRQLGHGDNESPKGPTLLTPDNIVFPWELGRVGNVRCMFYFVRRSPDPRARKDYVVKGESCARIYVEEPIS